MPDVREARPQPRKRFKNSSRIHIFPAGQTASDQPGTIQDAEGSSFVRRTGLLPCISGPSTAVTVNSRAQVEAVKIVCAEKSEHCPLLWRLSERVFHRLRGRRHVCLISSEIALRVCRT